MNISYKSISDETEEQTITILSKSDEFDSIVFKQNDQMIPVLDKLGGLVALASKNIS